MSKRKASAPAQRKEPASTRAPGAGPQAQADPQPQLQPEPRPKAQQRSSAGRQAKRGSRRNQLLAAAGGLAVVILLALGVAYSQGNRQQAAVPVTPTSVPFVGPIGAANACRQNPRFAATQGLPESLSISTNERMIKGLVVYDSSLMPDSVALGSPGVYQHPTWDDAGYLGPVATDGDGNIYTAASPRTSLIDNPPEKSNIVYKIDSRSGEMRPLVDLPAAAPPPDGNPFGIMGLTYDCNTESLYVASVMGSTYGAEAGRIYQVDAKSGEVLDTLEGIDALGIAVFNGTGGKRLYYGAARRPELRSIALDSKGHFMAVDKAPPEGPRTDVVLSEIGNGYDLRARRIAFSAAGNEMAVRAVEFYYTLVAASEVRSINFTFAYDEAADTWTFVR